MKGSALTNDVFSGRASSFDAFSSTFRLALRFCNILNALRDQAAPPPGLTDTLIGIYRDATQDRVLRDYAIQHLVAWYEQGAEDAPESPGKIRAVLEEAVRQNDSIAGTALLGMHRLAAEDPAFDGSQIDQLALSQAQSAGTDPAARITAIQVCAERGLAGALPAIESLAQTANCLPLRLSAIAALGRLGAAEQAGALRRMETGNEEALRVALRAARLRLEPKERFY